MFYKYEALQLLPSLVRLARNESHKKADRYAAALDEIRARMDALDQVQLQRLFRGLLGHPVRVKVGREATTILKGVGKAAPPPAAMDPLCADCLLTRISKALCTFDALSGGLVRTPTSHPGNLQCMDGWMTFI